MMTFANDFKRPIYQNDLSYSYVLATLPRQS